MASGPWIRTDATRGSLSLPGVVTEPGGSAVGELTVTSCCEWPLVVYMETSDPGVVFQLQNENLRNGDPDDDPADWNQLFNEIDQIDRIDLAPGASTTVVISFRVPEIRASPTPNSTQLSSSRRGQDLQSGASKSALSERHAITTATATIELRAVHTTVVSQQSGGGGAIASDGDRTSEATATASNVTTAEQMADGLGAAATEAAVASRAEAAAAATAAAAAPADRGREAVRIGAAHGHARAELRRVRDRYERDRWERVPRPCMQVLTTARDPSYRYERRSRLHGVELL